MRRKYFGYQARWAVSVFFSLLDKTLPTSQLGSIFRDGMAYFHLTNGIPRDGTSARKLFFLSFGSPITSMEFLMASGGKKKKKKVWPGLSGEWNFVRAKYELLRVWDCPGKCVMPSWVFNVLLDGVSSILIYKVFFLWRWVDISGSTWLSRLCL